MTKLDEEKGLQIGETYRNDKAAQAFAEFIALDARRELILLLRTDNFYLSLLMGQQIPQYQLRKLCTSELLKMVQ